MCLLMTKYYKLSRVGTFGFGLATSSVATSAVTLAYGIAYRVPNLDVPILTGVGVGLIGAAAMLCGARRPQPPASRGKRRTLNLKP